MALDPARESLQQLLMIYMSCIALTPPSPTLYGRGPHLRYRNSVNKQALAAAVGDLD